MTLNWMRSKNRNKKPSENGTHMFKSMRVKI